jgi:hypothetical protein
LAELIVDTDQKLLTIQDGVTAGGIYLAPLTYAQAAFATANAAGSGSTGQAAFDKANSANVLAQSSYDYANTIYISTTAAFNQSNLAFDKANSANSLAQAAYDAANSAGSSTFTQAAFDKANSANVLAQSAYNASNTVNTYVYSANTFLQANDASTLTLAKSYTDTANTNLKAYSDFTYFTKSGGTVSGNVTVQQDLTVLGNVAFTGNVISVQVTGNTGQFFGYSSNGFNALYAGIPSGYLIQPQMITQFTANYNGYAGVNHQNINTGANSSSDVFLTADNGTFLEGYVDIGIASSSYNYPDYGLIGPNDGYFLVAGNTTTGGGDLILATELQNDIIFAVNGVNTVNDVMRLSAANTNLQIYPNIPSVNTGTGSLVVTGGVGVSGNVYASGIYDNGLELGVYSQASFNKANTVNVYAYSAYSTANSAQANTINIQGVDDRQNLWITSNSTLTQASFDKANSTDIFAQAAFGQANAASFSAQAAFDSTNTNIIFTQSAYNYANSLSSGTTDSFARETGNAAFNKANSANVLAQNSYNFANTVNVYSYSAYAQANTANNKASAAYIMANAAFDFANTISAGSVDSYARQTGNAAFNKANTVGIVAQAAFDKANTGGGGSSLDTTLSVGTNYTLSTNANFILASNTITITLANAVGNTGYKYNIKNIGNGAITVIGQSGQTIDDNTNMVMSYKYSVMGVLSDGTNWSIF